MHARIARFEGVTPEQVEIVKRYSQEKWIPDMRQMSGSAGLLELGDTDNGRALSVAFFDSAEALEAGDRQLNEMSPPEELQGIRRTSVERYEVILHEVTGEPAAARVSWLEGSTDKIDEGTRFAEETILPRARTIDGWDGYFMLGDRQTGKAALITLWENTDALRASEEQANQLRQQSADAFGNSIVGVERYEVVAIEVPARAGAR